MLSEQALMSHPVNNRSFRRHWQDELRLRARTTQLINPCDIFPNSWNKKKTVLHKQCWLIAKSYLYKKYYTNTHASAQHTSWNAHQSVLRDSVRRTNQETQDQRDWQQQIGRMQQKKCRVHRDGGRRQRSNVHSLSPNWYHQIIPKRSLFI